jgi:hypothetical protein
MYYSGILNHKMKIFPYQCKLRYFGNIVTDLTNMLPGNSFVNTNTGVFCAVCIEQKHEEIGSLLPGNAAVNMHPQQWETLFSVLVRAKELS